ncbi:UNVERIFIED_CONTAM: hypothetical protein FKN15_047461 [Acipenser sinensis]
MREAKMHQEELHNRAQALTGSLQKIQHEKEHLLKDIAAMKENLSKVSQSLKESQMHMEKQKQNGKEACGKVVNSVQVQVINEQTDNYNPALEQKGRIHQKVNQELQKKAEVAIKEVNKVKSLLQKKDKAEKELNSQLTSAITQLLKLQEGLKEKEKAEQQLQTEAQESSTQEKRKWKRKKNSKVLL